MFHGDIDSADYDDLDNYDDSYSFADDDEYRKIGSVRRLFKEFDRDYYKPITTDDGLVGEEIITLYIRVEEMEIKIYHQKDVSMW